MPFLSRIFFTLIFLRASWSPGDAASSAPKDPCASFPCGGPEAGVCTPKGKSYTCQCNPGFVAKKKTCVPEGPCGSYPCGMYSERCIPVDSKNYRCTCKKGFAENSLIKPTCAPAEGQCGNHPCGLGGLCRLGPEGKHECDCLEGFEPGPSSKGVTCRSKQKAGCESQPCGHETIGKCVETGSGYFCICREGALPFYNEFGSPTCVMQPYFDPCYPGSCGEKGVECTFDGSHRTCTCQPGFEPKVVNSWGDHRCYATDESAGQTPGGGGAGGEPGAPGTPGGGGQSKISSTVIIAGGIVAALLLIGAIAGIIAFRRSKKSKDGEPVEHQRSVDFEGRDGSGLLGDEGDVLIKARNDDWAQ